MAVNGFTLIVAAVVSAAFAVAAQTGPKLPYEDWGLVRSSAAPIARGPSRSTPTFCPSAERVLRNASPSPGDRGLSG